MTSRHEYSRKAAETIKAATLDALQAADEIGGPDFPEYIALMEALQFECAKRAENARLVYQSQPPTAAELAEALRTALANDYPQARGDAFQALERWDRWQE